MSRIIATLALLMLAGCAVQPIAPPVVKCPVCPAPELPKPLFKPFEQGTWESLMGWGEDDLAPAFSAFLSSCNALQRREIWRETCLAAKSVDSRDGVTLRAWFEAQLQPWQLISPDGGREGLITGYYEPLLKGSRAHGKPYLYPVQGVPPDLIDVELGELYPELKHMRLRGRLEGRRLVPYFSRAEWEKAQRSDEALLWVDDVFDLFFMQIQGSGQVLLEDGSRVRVSYADQNGHPYRSIGRWLIDQGQLKAEQASMQGIKAWAMAHPNRLHELLNANPSLVFFRELPVTEEGPPGALGVPLTAERSIAVDARFTPLGAPVWLVTTYPNSERTLTKLMLAQDTGGAIRGPVRADFFWGSGFDAGSQAGKMRQKGQMWALLPKGFVPR
jgi:membrane-bound lytic murein transglycosylase A